MTSAPDSDVEQWFEQLAGRLVADPEEKQMQHLRDVIREHAACAADESAKQRLLSRLENEGWFARTSRRPVRAPWALAAGVLLAVGLSGILLLHEPEQPGREIEHYKGLPIPLHVVASEPQVALQRALAELQGSGLSPSATSGGNAVDVQVSPAQLDRFQAWAAEYGLRVEAAGFYRIEFAQR